MNYRYNRFKLSFATLLITLSTALVGQTITMKSIQAEGEISLSMATYSENSLVTIDWGDGTPQSYTVGTVERECKGPATQNTITISGDISKLNCIASKLIELDISHCPNLWVLQAAYNNLGEIDLSHNVALGNLEIFGNMIKEIDLTTCTKLERLVCSDNYLWELNVDNCPELKYLDCTRMGRLTQLDLTNNKKLTNLLVNECSITEIKLPNEYIPLVEFWCHKNQITSLDLSPYTDLQEVNCSDNPLTTLSLNAPEMTQLLIMNTPLADFSFLASMPLLTYLMLTGNEHLTSVDLSHNPLLTDLGLSKSALSEIDLSAQEALQQLWIEESQLTHIDLSACKSLTSAKLKDNQISQVNLPTAGKLSILALPQNALMGISLEGQSSLLSLDLGTNQLKELNLSGCPNLQILNIGNNQIHTLDLQYTPQLQMLGVVGNGMSAEELDNIYLALPTLDNPSSKVNLYNGTKKDQAARTSTTDIALERNWKPDVLGDGSWRSLVNVEQLELRMIQQEDRLTIYPDGNGRPLALSLYNTDGTLLYHTEMIGDTSSVIYLPARGSFLLLVEDIARGSIQTHRILY